MIGGQDEESCGKSGNGETPREHKRRGGSAAARGTKSCTEINGGVTSGSAPLSRLFIFRWN
ncbi:MULTISPECIES: hypothetical protein [Priestia]|uniref:hypothetical protein n=1 Tax=Priestia TaxID=2800373 RepID=UPI00159C1D07|nr:MULTISPECIES: hypothetical protein [Priestia]MDC0703736.1 hypothetical protein [Priestia sp. AB]MED4208511.1 hypothetical protein [Priestia megaterium]